MGLAAIGLVLAQFGAMVPSLPPNMIPPARFDHPYAGRVDKLWLSPEGIVRICTPGHPACTFSHHPPGVCQVYITTAVKGTWMEAVLVRHEVAHCNGWPGNHPR